MSDGYTSHECGLCNSEFNSLTEKITHNCPEKPEDRCKKNKCGREPKDDYGYCAAHKPKVWSGLVGEKEIEEREVPVWDVEVHYSYQLRVNNVKAPNKDRAIEKAEEAHDPRLEYRVHENVSQRGTVTETEDLGWKQKPPKFKKLDSMKVETVGEDQ